MIAMIVVLAVVALLLVWLSLSMAATEGAVGRVTRASLNTLFSKFKRMPSFRNSYATRKSGGIHKVQRLVADRYATAGSCAFFRICCNVVDGVLVTVIAGMLDAPLWAELLAGFVFAIVIAVDFCCWCVRVVPGHPSQSTLCCSMWMLFPLRFY